MLPTLRDYTIIVYMNEAALFFYVVFNIIDVFFTFYTMLYAVKCIP